jgi:sortase A
MSSTQRTDAWGPIPDRAAVDAPPETGNGNGHGNGNGNAHGKEPAPKPVAPPVPVPKAAPELKPAPGTEPAPEPAPSPQSQSPPAAPPTAPPAGRPELRVAGVSLLLLSAFLLGFAAYLFGFSSISESRDQTRLYSQLRYELSQAVAPTGPTAPGTPVAILDFPTVGVKNLVVVEGTTPENLMLGPGLVRNSPLPGQAGVSEIYGRLVSFGAPFSKLGQLHVGDEIKATTSLGVSTYRIAAFGDSSNLVSDPAPNRLILLTAGSPYVPTYYSYVDADLISTVQPQPGNLPPIYTDETALSGDTGALVIALLWALALVGVSAGCTIAASRWAPWPAYLAAAPIVIVVVWNLYRSLAAVLPNVY